jgi:RNase adaptor protein for sRNA GlmZ degradation
MGSCSMPLCMTCDELTDVAFDGDEARCPRCGTVAARRATLPLIIVTGTSGAGKTTIVERLPEALPEFDVFDCDLLLGHFADFERLFGAWLAVAWSLAMQNRRVVLALSSRPEVIERQPERQLWRNVLFLNLHCDDDERERRLRARPAWRNSATDEFIANMKPFAAVLIQEAAATVDTTNRGVDDVLAEVTAWIRGIHEPA